MPTEDWLYFSDCLVVRSVTCNVKLIGMVIQPYLPRVEHLFFGGAMFILLCHVYSVHAVM
jgi:hypothetical protein